MAYEELQPCGWISDGGTFAYAPSVTGPGCRPVLVPVAFDGDCLTVTLTCPVEES